ncbi:MAG TPA: YcxB family protein [Chitinophagaceae bacterium]|nr:YcxB family protein [Chitinophagaceae bacterium]
MQIKTNLTQRDFINVNFVLMWKKITLKIALGIVLLLMIYSIYMQVSYGKSFHLDTIAWPLLMLAFLSLFTLVGSILNYRSNSRLKETIEYNFGDTYLEVKGDSFSSKLTWDKIYKVTKTKKWLLIWQSRYTANVIPLRDVWEGDITGLKEILDRHHVKNNL